MAAIGSSGARRYADTVSSFSVRRPEDGESACTHGLHGWNRAHVRVAWQLARGRREPPAPGGATVAAFLSRSCVRCVGCVTVSGGRMKNRRDAGAGAGACNPYGGAPPAPRGVWRVGVVCGRGARAVPEMRKAEYLLNMSSILCAGASATKTDYAPARLRLLSRAHLKRPPAQTVNSKHTTRGTPPDLRKGKLSRPECNFTFPSPDRLLARARLAEPP